MTVPRTVPDDGGGRAAGWTCKPETVYAYVSRGLLTSVASGRRASLFAQDEVDRLARARPGRAAAGGGDRAHPAPGSRCSTDDEPATAGGGSPSWPTRPRRGGGARCSGRATRARRARFSAPARARGRRAGGGAALPAQQRLDDRLRVAVAAARPSTRCATTSPARACCTGPRSLVPPAGRRAARARGRGPPTGPHPGRRASPPGSGPALRRARGDADGVRAAERGADRCWPTTTSPSPRSRHGWRRARGRTRTRWCRPGWARWTGRSTARRARSRTAFLAEALDRIRSPRSPTGCARARRCPGLRAPASTAAATRAPSSCSTGSRDVPVRAAVDAVAPALAGRPGGVPQRRPGARRRRARRTACGPTRARRSSRSRGPSAGSPTRSRSTPSRACGSAPRASTPDRYRTEAGLRRCADPSSDLSHPIEGNSAAPGDVSPARLDMRISVTVRLRGVADERRGQ